MIIREANSQDLPAIIAIYNQAVEDGGCTADTEPDIPEKKRVWFDSLNNERFGIYVVAHLNEIIGYFYFAPWRDGRLALSSTVEVSFYIARSFRAKGVGNLILEEAIKIAEKKAYEHLLAILLDVNFKSKSLLEKFGFTVVGHLKKIAKFKNGDCGQYIMLKDI